MQTSNPTTIDNIITPTYPILRADTRLSGALVSFLLYEDVFFLSTVNSVFICSILAWSSAFVIELLESVRVHEQ